MSLAYRAVLGALWTITSSVGGRLVGLVANIVLAALLTPEQYGEANVAMIIVYTANMATYLGFGQYLVANPKAGKDVAFHATFYHITVGWLALLAVVLLGGYFAKVYATPDLGFYISGVALAVAMDRVSFIPGRILAREMRFKVLGLSQMSGEFMYAGGALTLAFMGYGAKSLVYASIMRSMVTLSILTLSAERAMWLTPTRISWKTTRELINFGLPISIGNILHFGSAKWDNLIVGKVLGTGVVGQYNFAYNIADIPAAQVGEHIGDVLLPSFAKLPDSDAQKRALARASGLLALIVFPLAVGLGAVAHSLQRAFLKPNWNLVGSMLVLLSVLSIVRPVGWLISSYLQATLRPRVIMILEAVKAVGILVFVYIFARWLGPLWACTAVGMAFGTHALASIWVIKAQDQVPMSHLLKPIGRPLLACVPMVVVVLAIRYGLHSPSWNAWAALVVEIASGAVAYVVGAFVFAGAQSRELISLLRGALKR
ncbi:MAG: oligosaccharide flippase family protein [Polyangiaceae bacterium]|nr:oligosaccharide flippase family protein [Polyangiaceae bacterium]MCB9605823.1 oligosaccharide flippase family protein [Polyangiaceae bacterium]